MSEKNPWDSTLSVTPRIASVFKAGSTKAAESSDDRFDQLTTITGILVLETPESIPFDRFLRTLEPRNVAPNIDFIPIRLFEYEYHFIEYEYEYEKYHQPTLSATIISEELTLHPTHPRFIPLKFPCKKSMSWPA
jgi:hypothetical protein